MPCATVINNTNTNYSFKRTLYNYDKLDATKFCNMLSRIDWADAMQMDPLTTAEHFNTIFFEPACNCMPVKTVTIRSKDADWINADIGWAIKHRDIVCLKKQNAAIKTKTGELIGLIET